MNWFATVIFAILEVALRSLRNAYTPRFAGNSSQIGSQLIGLNMPAKPRTRPVLAVALSIVLIVCFTSMVTTPFVQAGPADPGHPAASISAGTFEAGNFVFPDNLTVNDFLTVNSTTLYVDAINGRVGIGTNTPSTNLNVKGTLGTALTGTFNTSDASNVANTSADLTSEISIWDAIKIVNASDSSDYEVFTVSAVTSANITLDSTPGKSWVDAPGYRDSNLFRVDNGDGTGKLIIDKTGNVGIGTASPGASLHTYSTGTTKGIRIDGTTSGRLLEGFINSDERFFFANTGDLYFSKGSASLVHNTGNGGLSLSGRTTDTDLFINGSTGYVGIGTTSPGGKLHVSGGNILIDDNQLIVIGDNVPYMFLRKDTANSWMEIQPAGTGWSGLDIGLGRDGSENPQLFLDVSSGNVGIGTTSPGAKLQVGDIWVDYNNPGYGVNIKMDSNSARGYIWRNSSNSTIFSIGALTNVGDTNLDYGYIGTSYSGSGNWMTFKSGDVGIGTASPDYKLDISSSHDSAPEVLHIGDVDSATHGIYLTPYGTDHLYNTITVGNTEDLRFQTGGVSSPTDIMTLKYTGNVGINDTNPSYTLDVNGTIRATGDILIDTTSVCQSDGTNCPSGMSNSSAWNRSGTDVFLANTGDSVGIGTASPGAKLDVNGTGRFYSDTNNGTIKFGSGEKVIIDVNSNRMDTQIWNGTEYVSATTILSSGDVGIGTTSPNKLLHVEGASNPYIRIKKTAAATEAGLVITQDDNTEWVLYNPASSNDLRLYRGADLVTFQNGGNVGIGTTSPNATLDVSGATSWAGTVANLVLNGEGSDSNIGFEDNGVAKFLLSTDAGTGDFEIWRNDGSWSQVMEINNSNGNVGIGTISPGKKLEISGDDVAYPTIRIRQTRYSPTAHYFDISYIDSGGLYFSDAAGDKNVQFSTGGSVAVGSGYATGAYNLPENGMIIQGNVGIGTASPTGKLEVSGGNFFVNGTRNMFFNSTSGSVSLYEDDDENGWAMAYGFLTQEGGENVGGFGAFGDSGGSGSLSYYYIGSAYNSPKMVIKNDTGNVGIGTTAPIRKLHVYSSSDDVIALVETDGENKHPFLSLDGNWSSDAHYGALLFKNNGDSIGGVRVYRDGANDAGALTFETQKTGESLTERVRIDSNGNVGIGTTDPNATLHLNASHDETNPIFRIQRGAGGQVWGIHENNNYFNIRDITGTDDRFTIDTSGKVGVDDTTPDAKLEVFASSGPQLMLTHTDNTDYANFTVDGDGNLTITSSSGNVIIQLG